MNLWPNYLLHPLHKSFWRLPTINFHMNSVYHRVTWPEHFGLSIGIHQTSSKYCFAQQWVSSSVFPALQHNRKSSYKKINAPFFSSDGTNWALAMSSSHLISYLLFKCQIFFFAKLTWKVFLLCCFPLQRKSPDTSVIQSCICVLPEFTCLYTEIAYEQPLRLCHSTSLVQCELRLSLRWSSLFLWLWEVKQRQHLL